MAQFGKSILAAPPKHGFDLIAWWLPIAGVLLGAAVLGVAAYRWSRTRAPAPAVPASDRLDPELERRLDEGEEDLDCGQHRNEPVSSSIPWWGKVPTTE